MLMSVNVNRTLCHSIIFSSWFKVIVFGTVLVALTACLFKTTYNLTNLRSLSGLMLPIFVGFLISGK